MKLYVLCENTSNQNNIIYEHGLSLYIETENHKILFDMGQTNAFLLNAEKMGVNLEKVDIAFLSHGHYDHGGGIKDFLKINKSAFIYANDLVFGMHFNNNNKYIGLDQSLFNSKRFIYTKNHLEIDKELSLYSCNDRTYKTDSYGLKIEKNGIIMPDDFLHEQYLIINKQDKKILISGCSHKGILNIMDWFHPDIFIGGFHFKKLNPKTDDKETLKKAADALLSYHTLYFTGHCTGTVQYNFLKKIMGNRLNYISAGDSVII